MFKYIIYTVIVVGIIYGIILSYPKMFFDNTYEYKNFTVYSHDTLKGNVDSVLDTVYEKLSQSEFFNPDFKYRFYIVKDSGQYSFLTAFKGEGYFYGSPFGGHIFLASADFEKNNSNCKNCPEQSTRKLDIVMTGAAIREAVRQSLETLDYLTTSKWKLEGYGEYIAGETGYFEPSDICKDESDNLWLKLHKRQLAVQMLMTEEDKLPFSIILDKNISYEAMEKRLKRRHCK